jgi:hypothetical protein
LSLVDQESEFENFSTMVEAYILVLDDIDMVLGVTWLQMFGKVIYLYDFHFYLPQETFTPHTT